MLAENETTENKSHHRRWLSNRTTHANGWWISDTCCRIGTFPFWAGRGRWRKTTRVQPEAGRTMASGKSLLQLGSLGLPLGVLPMETVKCTTRRHRNLDALREGIILTKLPVHRNLPGAAIEVGQRNGGMLNLTPQLALLSPRSLQPTLVLRLPNFRKRLATTRIHIILQRYYRGIVQCLMFLSK